MTLVALLRHGETAWSREGRIQGRSDVPLNEAGRATLTGSVLPDEFRSMRSVTSPLLRCVETATLLEMRDCAREQRIAEMCWGEWEGRVLARLRAEYGESMRKNESRGLDFMPPGGESPRDVLGRVSGWLAAVAAGGLSTLAIAHRGVIRVILAAATGWDMRGKPPVRLEWGAIHVFRLDRDGTPSVDRMNIPLQPRAKVNVG